MWAAGPTPLAITMGCAAGRFDINTTDPNAIVSASGVTVDVAKAG
jgi:hypothetical protein